MIMLYYIFYLWFMWIMWFLEEMGFDYGVKIYLIIDGFLCDLVYLVKFSGGWVLVFEIDGVVIFESFVIMEYLCEMWFEYGLVCFVGEFECIVFL